VHLLSDWKFTMKNDRILSAAAVAAVLFSTGFQLLAQPVSSEISPQPILAVMQRVADWQLANPSAHKPTDWTQGAGDAGLMALAGISGDAKYRDAMLAMGETNQWKPGSRKFHADDHAVGQTYAELYLLYREPKMIAPLQARFDDILAQPSTVTNLDFTQPRGRAGEKWSWCDALFMGPPTWVRLYAAIVDARYLDFAVTNWWLTTDYLYDKDEHLFFRDSTYFKKTESNGKKVFWSRGNGWVMGGLVRVLQYLPMNNPDRPRFEQLFKDMSAKILTCQQPDGLWRASLLDPDSYPLKETSGSGFYTYALAWGVNQGLLEKEKYEPTVRKAWAALVSCVEADGKLTHVQPIGADPKKFAEDSTEVYGVGAFLLAGSEVYRMAVLESAKSTVDHPSIPPPAPGHTNEDFTVTWERTIEVKIANPSAFGRDCETVELNRYDKENSNLFGGVRFWPNAYTGSSTNARIAVMDGVSSRVLDSQEYEFENDVPNHQKVELLFQVDLAPGETRTFYILDASALPAVPPPIVKTMARYVPERFDDFAWESDRIAHRIYGQALIKAEGTISSGADVWIKKDRGLIVDTMYATKHYHEDNGSFMDDYRVGKSRGCGGLGIWDGKKLFVSSNWRNWKLITTGPIRSEFELTYDAWDAGNGRKVSEVKRFSIDAGSWLTKVTSTISSEDKTPLTIGVGLAERACPTNREQFIANDLTEGWMTYWQPEDQPKGITAVAVLLPKDSVKEFVNDNPTMPDSVKHAAVPQPTHEGYPAIRNQLAITQVEVGQPFTYYFGACWDRSGDFTNHVQWENYVRRFAERRDQPLQVTVGN
jgi:unsaturated rhamnogalacturonyl hydrolase